MKVFITTTFIIKEIRCFTCEKESYIALNYLKKFKTKRLKEMKENSNSNTIFNKENLKNKLL